MSPQCEADVEQANGGVVPAASHSRPAAVGGVLVGGGHPSGGMAAVIPKGLAAGPRGGPPLPLVSPGGSGNSAAFGQPSKRAAAMAATYMGRRTGRRTSPPPLRPTPLLLQALEPLQPTALGIVPRGGS